MTDVQAVILAGGKGTRLRPVTVDLPKPLVPVGNRPLVTHQLRHLAASGITDVTLALGYGADHFETVELEAKRLGINLRLVVEPSPLGTGGALRWCADAHAFDEDRPLLWLNGDVVATPNVRELERAHRANDALITLWLTSVRDVGPFGVLELANDGHVERFLEKPAPEETDSRLINAGILMLDPRVLRRIPSGSFVSFERQLLPGLVSNDEAVYGLFDGGYWMDIGQPRAYLDANRHVLEGRVTWWPAGHHTEDGMWEGESVSREGVRVIRPAVLGDRVCVDGGARLLGRTVLGADTVIGSGTLLEDCVLFSDVEVGRDAQIIDSIVCAGARIADGVILRDTIVGARSTVGTANELRHTRLWNDVTLPPRAVIVDA